MKKFSLVLLTAIAFAGIIGLSSCNKDIAFFVPIDDEQVCIPPKQFVSGSGIVNTYEITNTQIQSAFSAAGVKYDASKIKSASFKGFKVRVATTTVNFNDISGISIYAKAEGTAGDGEQVAYVNPTGSGITEIDLGINGTNIKSLLLANKIIVTVRTFNNKNNTPETCFTLTSGVIAVEATK